MRSNQNFDVSISGNIDNVYTNSQMPRGLSVGDHVRVSDVRQDNNDTRDVKEPLQMLCTNGATL